MEKLMTAPQIAEYLGVKLSTIYQCTHEGFIPHFKMRGLLRFDESDITEWLSKFKQPSRTVRKIDVGMLGV